MNSPTVQEATRWLYLSDVQRAAQPDTERGIFQNRDAPPPRMREFLAKHGRFGKRR
jgi:hypothetical protein